ncbi:MAG: N-methyl-L-tryptophan oxidase [Candidatus Baltobacteraceae bacterium]
MTIVVLGLGAMGSAALYHLARRGENAIGIEQFGPAHTKGASHGRSRIIRQAYFEDPRYVPLLLRAYELWDALNEAAAESVWDLCGGLAIGMKNCALISGNLRAAQRYGLPHEVLDRRAMAERFPAFRLNADEIAVYEAAAGVLFPERCVLEHLRQAVEAGAQAHFGTRVTAIAHRSEGIELSTADGATIACDRLVATAGPWIRDFFDVPVRVERNVQHWFAKPAADAPQQIFMLERAGWPRLFYGFPDFGDGVKAAFHHSGEFVSDAGEHDPVARPDEVHAVGAALAQTLSHAPGEHLRSEPCMYAVTPDEHRSVAVAGGFSGHGFKFASVAGEILADLATAGTTSRDISLFDPLRFA